MQTNDSPVKTKTKTIVSTTIAIEFPTVEAPKPRTTVVASAFGFSMPASELPGYPGPLLLDAEPPWLTIAETGETIGADKALSMIEADEARLADPETLVADFEYLHRKPRDGDFVARNVSANGQVGLPNVARFTVQYVETVYSLVGAEYALRKRETALRFADSCDRSEMSAFMPRAEVAEVFGVSEDTIDAWTGQKIPAAIHLGGRVLFKREAIARFVQAV